MYARNLGKNERILRFVLAIILLVVVTFYNFNMTLRWSVGIIGVILLITSFVSWCPIYSITTHSSRGQGLDKITQKDIERAVKEFSLETNGKSQITVNVKQTPNKKKKAVKKKVAAKKKTTAAKKTAKTATKKAPVKKKAVAKKKTTTAKKSTKTATKKAPVKKKAVTKKKTTATKKAPAKKKATSRKKTTSKSKK